MKSDFFKKINFFVNKLFIYIPDRPGLIFRVGFLRFIFLIGFIIFWHGLKGSTQSYPDFNQADISTGTLIKVGGLVVKWAV